MAKNFEELMAFSLYEELNDYMHSGFYLPDLNIKIRTFNSPLCIRDEEFLRNILNYLKV